MLESRISCANTGFQILKWQFANPSEEHVEQLKTQLESVTKPALLAQLFHKDFRQHLKALETMIAASARGLATSQARLLWTFSIAGFGEVSGRLHRLFGSASEVVLAAVLRHESVGAHEMSRLRPAAISSGNR